MGQTTTDLLAENKAMRIQMKRMREEMGSACAKKRRA